jgi:sulfite exporter TauE/SafE
MEAMLLAVVTASFLGSGHCAGMCGPLAMLASMGPASRSELGRRMSYYHAGRLMGYTSLGAVVGGLGRAMDWGGELAGWQRLAAMTAGGLMVLLGVTSLIGWFRRSPAHRPLPGALQRLLEKGHRRLSLYGPGTRAWGMGLLTVMLPCGWLYAFLITAAGSGSAAGGGLIMGAFWLGTVPILAAIPLGWRPMSSRVRAYLPALAASLLIATGMFTLAVRAEANLTPLHQASRVDRGPAEEIARVKSLTDERMPCCHAD